MRTFITSDLSLTDSPRDEYRLQFLQRLPALTTTQRIDRVYILGDLTEAKDRHPAFLVNQIVRGLAALAHRRQVTVLQGNHDYLQAEWPFFAFLSEVDNIEYIDRPTMASGNLLWLPHTRDWQQDWRSIDMRGARRILTHNTFAGAVGANGFELGGIPLDALPNVPIISGDIHNPQRNGRLIYVGAPYTVDFGDEFEPRALILDDDKLLTLRLSGPQKRVVTFNSLDNISIYFSEVMAGDRVRIRYILAQSDYPMWPSIQQRIRELCAHENFILDSVVPVVTGSTAAATLPTQPRTTVATDEQILKSYCRRRDLDAKVEQQGVELL